MDDDELQEPAPTVGEEEFIESLDTAAYDFDKTLKSKLSAKNYKKLRTIGAFIMRGLEFNEACILARVSPESLKKIMEKNEDVQNFIIFKQIAFKAGLLNTLSASAIAGKQAKSAGYLLEKKYPAEFDPKKNDAPPRDPDMIEKAIEYVRRGGDATPLVQLPPGQKPSSPAVTPVYAPTTRQ